MINNRKCVGFTDRSLFFIFFHDNFAKIELRNINHLPQYSNKSLDDSFTFIQSFSISEASTDMKLRVISYYTTR